MTTRDEAIEMLTPALDPSEKATKRVIEFDRLAEAVPQIVWITGPDGKNIYFNKQWEDYTGLTVEEGHGHGWNIPFHPDDRQRAWEAWQHAWQTDGVYSLECRLRRADGIYRWWLIRGRALHDEKGTIINWYGTWTDVEDIKQTEEALKRARDEAEAMNQKLQKAYDEIRNLYEKTKALNQFKTQMFANVSHELRTPLTLILAPIENLLSMGLPEQATERLKLAQRNARGLLKQINDLLDVARLEAGKTTVTYSETDLAKLIKHIASGFEIPAKEKHVRFSVITPSSMPAQIDIEKFERILVNLLSNAFKFTPEGGTIRCQVHEDLPPFAVIEVVDSGPGVPEAFRDSIFEQFFQIPGSTRFGGTGLGLSIVKEFVEIQHGRVTVGQSSEGGALFRIEIPVTAPEGTAVIRRPNVVFTAPSFVEESLPPFRSKKGEQTRSLEPAEGFSEAKQRKSLILVVEDNPDMREYICETLGPDVAIETAENGREGFEKARAIMPDLIISDIMMPEMGGDEMFRKIRANRELKSIPFILVTAKADEELRIELLREGAIEYLIKPFMPEELKAKARSFLEVKAREVKYRQLMESAQVDVGTVVKASQAVSGEIDLGKLIEMLLRIAVEHAGAERGLLILFRSNKLWLEAEATTGSGGVEVIVRKAEVTPADLPESLLHHVIQTQESVILDDAAAPTLFSADAYVQQQQPRSVLCLPLVKQAKLVGALYLENNLTPRVFTSNRIAVLEVLASQAAISLENATLYADLQTAYGELRVSEQRFRDYTETASDWLWVTDREHRFTFFSEHSGAFGYDWDKPIGKRRWDVAADFALDPEKWREYISVLERREPFRDFVYEVRRTDGSPGIISASGKPVFDAEGRFSGYRGVASDLTDRKRAEQALQRSESYLSEAQRLSHTGSWGWNVATREITHWSKEIYRLYGFDPQAGIPPFGAFLQRIHRDDRARLAEASDRAISDGAEYELDFQAALPDGTTKYIHEIGHPVYDAAGELVELVGTDMDITERKRAETEIRESERRYREIEVELAHANRVATMGHLSASIAHEVNQPIAAAITNADAALRWLGAQPPDLEEVRQALGRIVKDGHRAGDVVGRIRDLIRKAPPRKEGLAINEAILEVIALTRSEVVKNGVSMQTQLAEVLPLIQGDRVQLQQVILNLIINAVEAMSSTGEGLRELRISTGKAESDGVLVAVRDSGPGLAPASLERLFEAFYTTKPGGLGMGLSICRSIIEAHGGRLWAAANVPQGASFHFDLPAHEVTAS
jgi:PAS domain S-box-containing protein